MRLKVPNEIQPTEGETLPASQVSCPPSHVSRLLSPPSRLSSNVSCPCNFIPS